MELAEEELASEMQARAFACICQPPAQTPSISQFPVGLVGSLRREPYDSRAKVLAQEARRACRGPQVCDNAVSARASELMCHAVQD